jgi:hypothetical protein
MDYAKKEHAPIHQAALSVLAKKDGHLTIQALSVLIKEKSCVLIPINEINVCNPDKDHLRVNSAVVLKAQPGDSAVMLALFLILVSCRSSHKITVNVDYFLI